MPGGTGLGEAVGRYNILTCNICHCLVIVWLIRFEHFSVALRRIAVLDYTGASLESGVTWVRGGGSELLGSGDCYYTFIIGIG